MPRSIKLYNKGVERNRERSVKAATMTAFMIVINTSADRKIHLGPVLIAVKDFDISRVRYRLTYPR